MTGKDLAEDLMKGLREGTLRSGRAGEAMGSEALQGSLWRRVWVALGQGFGEY